MTLSQILQLRKDTTGVYFAFIEYFVSSVVGKNHYKYHCCDKHMLEYVTVSNEALAILIFENKIDTWNNMAEKNIIKNSKSSKSILMVVLPKKRLQVLVGIKDGLVVESSILINYLICLEQIVNLLMIIF